MEPDGTENDGVLADALKSIDALVDEAVQVYELNKEKTNVVDDLYNSLKVITNFLGFAVDLHPNLLNLTPETRAVLTPSLDILIIKPNFKTEQKKFYQLSLDEASKIMQFAIPTLISMTKTNRIQIHKKITLLRGATKKLKRVSNANNESIVTDSSMPVERIES